MKPENAIEVKNVTKKFRVYPDKGHTLKEKILFHKRRAYEERVVLDQISFEVKKGEAVGLIGQNGCGKSTTLKLLTRIIYPDSGTIEMCGRVSSLLELGAGFHPDMSGRENIYINASIFGLTKKEIETRIGDIIAFSELEEYIDQPVRTYSSGMYMRLAFAVAIHVDADILLIDEILAVGDAGFAAKCFNRLKEIKAGGTTIVIVSHSMGQIEEICSRSFWIHQGKIAAGGNPREINMQYLESAGKKRQQIVEAKKERQRKEQQSRKQQGQEQTDKDDGPQIVRFGNGDVRITSVRVKREEEKESDSFLTGDRLIMDIGYQVFREMKEAVIGVGIFRIDGVRCYGTNTKIDQTDSCSLTEDGTVRFEVPVLTLLPGKYLLDVAIESGAGILADYCKEVSSFEVFSPVPDVGIARIGHRWRFL